MKINNDYWGTDRIVENGVTYFGDSSIKNYSELVIANTVFDDSICYGIDFNSALCSYAIIDSGTEYVQFKVPSVARYFTRPYMFSGGTELVFIDRYRCAYDVTDISSMLDMPIAGLRFNNLVFLVRIVATTVEKIVTNGGADRYDYDDYISNGINIDPIIIGIELVPYYSISGSRSVLNTIGLGDFCTLPTKQYGGIGHDVFYVSPLRGGIIIGSSHSYHPTVSSSKEIFRGIDNKFFEIRGYTGRQGRIYLMPTFMAQPSAVLSLVSYLGVFFTTNTDFAKYKPITDSGIYCGRISNDGKLIGGSSNGTENSKQPQADWNKPDDYTKNSGFNGVTNTDPNVYTDKIDLNKPKLSNVNVFNRSFAVNSNSVRQLADFLWNADETKFQEIIKGLALMGENPMNGIIDLRLFPFNVALKNSATQAEPIVIGRTNTGVNGIKLTENVNSLIDLGECTFFEKFKNFLDFEPYTTAQLYIPYIGVVPVSTAEFMGHKISVKMLVDYTTGAGTAIVFKDDIPFIYRNGVVGVSIPMTGTDSASYASTVIGNVVNGAIGGISSIASNNVGGLIDSTKQLYSGFATGINYQTASASAPAISTWQPQKCYFIIDRPILNVPDNYGRTVGYACEVTGKLSDFKGFTVVSNPEISFKCTETEKTMLSQLLTAGVFI